MTRYVYWFQKNCTLWFKLVQKVIVFFVCICTKEGQTLFSFVFLSFIDCIPNFVFSFSPFSYFLFLKKFLIFIPSLKCNNFFKRINLPLDLQNVKAKKMNDAGVKQFSLIFEMFSQKTYSKGTNEKCNKCFCPSTFCFGTPASAKYMCFLITG